MAWAVRGRSSEVFGRSVYRGDRGRRCVALTFDDGPSEGTPRILELLAEHSARATFFCCGMNVQRHPLLLRELQSAGHEIGNHTYSHPQLCFRSPAFIGREIGKTQNLIEEATGEKPRLFRAPYGIRWFGLNQIQRCFGLLGVMWTVIGLDWKLSAAQVAARVVSGASKGAIICLHDGRTVQPNPEIGETIEAVRRVLPMLRDRGFGFETVSQILCPSN